MIHPNTALKYISNEIGYGVVATEFIPAGTITWVMDLLDRSFLPVEIRNLPTVYQDILDVYTFRNNLGNYILCWDNGRYVNHSFNSNCLTTAYDFEIAVRDILPGEQLTDDYGYLNIDKPFRAADEGTRRKIVYPDDLKKYYRKWDQKLQNVFPSIIEVNQPLKDLLSPKIWKLACDVALGDRPMDSILKNYYDVGKG